MKLTEEQVQALVAWAYLDYDPEAIKGSGALFDAAFKVAQEVRDATETLCACGDFHNEQKCPNCGKEVQTS